MFSAVYHIKTHTNIKPPNACSGSWFHGKHAVRKTIEQNRMTRVLNQALNQAI